MKSGFLALLLLAAPLAAFSQVDATTAHQINRLKTGTPEQRIDVAEDVFGAGIEEPAIYQAIAEELTAGLDRVTEDDERLDEYAWYTKALASSGDLVYLPLIERAIATRIRFLVRHGKDARELLQETAATGRPYLTEDKVRLITETQAQHCVYMRQATCEALGPPEECVEEQREEALAIGADSMQIMTMMNASGFVFATTAVTVNFYDCRSKPAAEPAGVTATATR